MVRELPHDYYERPGEPELHTIGNTANYLEAEPDFGAGGHKRAVPFLSAIGRGPMGEGVYPVIEQDDNGNFVFTLVSDVTGEVVMRSGNLSAGEMYITSPEHEVVPGENSYFTIHIKRNDDIKSYMLTIPPGAEGSRIYLTKRLIDYDSGGVYIFDIGDLYYDGQNGWPSKPFPRPNDTIIFTTKKANGGASLCFGHIEQAAGTQVVATGLSYIDAVIPLIGENGNWFVNGVDTGHRAIGVDGVSPILAGFEPNVINVDPATGELPDDPNSISIFSYTWDGQAITCVHELYLVDLDGVISDVIATSPETSRWILNLHEILDGYDLREYSGLRCRSTESNPWENDYPRVTFNTCAFTVDPEVVIDIPATLWWQTDNSVIPITADYGVADQPIYIPRCSLKDQINSIIPDDFEYASTPSASVRYKTSTGTIGIIGVGVTVGTDKTVMVSQVNLAAVLGQLKSEGSIPLSLRIRAGAYGTPSNYGCMPEINVPFIIDQDLSSFVTDDELSDVIEGLDDVTYLGYYVNGINHIVLDENFEPVFPLGSGTSDAFTISFKKYISGLLSESYWTLNVGASINILILCYDNETGDKLTYNIPTTVGTERRTCSVYASALTDVFQRIKNEGRTPYLLHIPSHWNTDSGYVQPLFVPITIKPAAITSEWLDTNLV